MGPSFSVSDYRGSSGSVLDSNVSSISVMDSNDASVSLSDPIFGRQEQLSSSEWVQSVRAENMDFFQMSHTEAPPSLKWIRR